MRCLLIATGLSILLTLPAAALTQDNAAVDGATQTQTAEDTQPLAYVEAGTSAGDALARSRTYLSRARQMANDDLTADFAGDEETPSHAPLTVDDEIVLPAGPDPD